MVIKTGVKKITPPPPPTRNILCTEGKIKVLIFFNYNNKIKDFTTTAFRVKGRQVATLFQQFETYIPRNETARASFSISAFVCLGTILYSK